MKKIFYALLALFTAAFANKLDPNWWQEKLKNDDLNYGYYDQPTLIVAISKQKKQLSLFEYDHGTLESGFGSVVMTGKLGQKLVEGDLKTPVGVYELTARFKPKDGYLGPLAFSLSYPNLLDHLQGRGGSGIWIHGYPINGERTDDNTRGCVALKNEILMEFDSRIDHARSLAVVSEGEYMGGNADEIASVLAMLYRWKDAWVKSDLDSYLGFYAPDFRRFDGMARKEFSSYKRYIFAKNERKSITFSNLAITPYPQVDTASNEFGTNTKIGKGAKGSFGSAGGRYGPNERLYRVSFFEQYKAKSHKFEGQKTLYVRINPNGEAQIVIEQ